MDKDDLKDRPTCKGPGTGYSAVSHDPGGVLHADRSGARDVPHINGRGPGTELDE